MDVHQGEEERRGKERRGEETIKGQVNVRCVRHFNKRLILWFSVRDSEGMKKCSEVTLQQNNRIMQP